MGNKSEGGLSTVHGFVSGRVQGVGFRWFVLQAARSLGLGGDVRNLRDGRVEFRARGDIEAVERFVVKVRQGPTGGRVDRIEFEDTTGDVSDEFTIR